MITCWLDILSKLAIRYHNFTKSCLRCLTTKQSVSSLMSNLERCTELQKKFEMQPWLLQLSVELTFFQKLATEIIILQRIVCALWPSDNKFVASCSILEPEQCCNYLLIVTKPYQKQNISSTCQGRKDDATRDAFRIEEESALGPFAWNSIPFTVGDRHGMQNSSWCTCQEVRRDNRELRSNS